MTSRRRHASASASASSSRSSAPCSPSPPRSSSGAVRRGAPSPSPDEASDQAMRLLKRMKPNQLRDLSKAAAALEKEQLARLELERQKRENKEKVAAFVVENENFADLVGDCYICLEPLLNNIGTTKFGVVSWKCRCTVPQKAHTGCLFSKISLAVGGARCDMCNSPIKFEKTVGGRSSATIRFQQDGDGEEEVGNDGSDSLSTVSVESSNESFVESRNDPRAAMARLRIALARAEDEESSSESGGDEVAVRARMSHSFVQRRSNVGEESSSESSESESESEVRARNSHSRVQRRGNVDEESSSESSESGSDDDDESSSLSDSDDEDESSSSEED